MSYFNIVLLCSVLHTCISAKPDFQDDTSCCSEKNKPCGCTGSEAAVPFNPDLKKGYMNEKEEENPAKTTFFEDCPCDSSKPNSEGSSHHSEFSPEKEVEVKAHVHDCRSKRENTGNCSAKSCSECACKECNCPHNPRNKNAGISNENFSNKQENIDFFAFLAPALQDKAIRVLKQGSELFKSFPESLSELTGKNVSMGDSFVASLKQKYADLKGFSLVSSAMSDFVEKQFTGSKDIGFSESPSSEHIMSHKFCSKEKLTPILFVPGLLGSALEERRSNTTWLPNECFTLRAKNGKEWTRNWVSIASLLEFHCWKESLKLSLEEGLADGTNGDSLEKLGFVNALKGYSASRQVYRLIASIGDIFSWKKNGSNGRNDKKTDPIPPTESRSTPHSKFSSSFLKAKFPPGIEIRPIEDGIEATRCLDSSNSWTCQTTSYFKNLLSYVTRRILPPSSQLVGGKVEHRIQGNFGEEEINSSSKQAGHVECPQYSLRKNVDVISFDFRLGGYELYNRMSSNNNLSEYGGFFEKMKAKIEQLYISNSKSKVAIVTHSLGGPLSMAFFSTYVDDDWKEKYVKKLVTLAAPFGGAIKALQASLLGETESALIPTWSTHSLLSSWPGIYMVYPTKSSQRESKANPSPAIVEVNSELHAELHKENFFSSFRHFISGTTRGLFGSDEHLSKSMHHSPAKKVYTAGDLAQLIREYPIIPNKYAVHLERLKPLFEFFRSPPSGIDMDCVYSTGVQTTKKIVYKSFSEGDIFTPEVIFDEEGDGTVRLESLALCRNWETDADIDIDEDILSDSEVDLYEEISKVGHRLHGTKQQPMRRTIQLNGVDHLDIITNSPKVWEFVMQSVNAE